MTEKLDQKIGGYGISAPLSNSSGRPSLRGNRDERKTWSTLHLLSAENAGWPKQGAIPAWLRRPGITQRTAVMAGADRKSGSNRRINTGDCRETSSVWEEAGQRT